MKTGTGCPRRLVGSERSRPSRMTRCGVSAGVTAEAHVGVLVASRHRHLMKSFGSTACHPVHDRVGPGVVDLWPQAFGPPVRMRQCHAERRTATACKTVDTDEPTRAHLLTASVEDLPIGLVRVEGQERSGGKEPTGAEALGAVSLLRCADPSREAGHATSVAPKR